MKWWMSPGSRSDKAGWLLVILNGYLRKLPSSALQWQGSLCELEGAVSAVPPHSSAESLRSDGNTKYTAHHSFRHPQPAHKACLNVLCTIRWSLTVSEMFMLARSSAFFSKELTHSFRFCLQREAAARFLSRKRCLLSSGSISDARRRRPPVGWAGDTWRMRSGVKVGHLQTWDFRW